MSPRANTEYIDRHRDEINAGVKEALHRSRAGLVTLHPITTYLDSLPVKLFEYMAAGRPIVASALPSLEEVLTDGLVVETAEDLLTQIVGGDGVTETGPSGAIALAGARTASGVRVLAADGSLFAHAGSAWREVATDVRVLATRAGR